MPVLIGGYELRPCETVAFTREPKTSDDGRYLGTVTRATLRGEITPECIAGVEVPLPFDQHLAKILQLQQEIRGAFAAPGFLLEVSGWDGSLPTKLACRTISGPDFEPGNWLQVCPYEVTVEGLEFANDVNPLEHYVETAGEDWAFDQAENPRITRATHTARAKGQTLYDGTGQVTVPAWKRARDFVRDHLKLGWTAVSTDWSPESGRDLAGQSAEAPRSTTAWNYTVTDQIDELGGTYQAVETWLLTDQPYYEDGTLQVRRAAEESGFVVSVTLSGTLHGLFEDQNDYDARIINARAGWEAIRPTLAARAAAAAPDATLTPHPFEFSSEEDAVAGTIAYQYTFTNRALVNDTWELVAVEAQSSLESPKTSVTVSGTITGALYPDVEADPNLKLERAVAQFGRVKGLLYQRAVAATGIANLQLCPVTARRQDDQAQGTVAYTYEFDNRLFNDVEEEFTVSRKSSSEDPRVVVTVEGTIKGLRTSSCSDPFQTPQDYFEAFSHALAYFGAIKDGLLSRAALYVPTAELTPAPWSTSYSQNLYAGTVSYAYEFTSQRHCYPFALSESITFSREGGIPVIAEVPVLGRKAGPVIQDMNTITSKRQSVAIELVLPIPANPCGFQEPPAVDVSIYAPHGSVVRLESDVTTWSYESGRFSRNVSWIYQD